MRFPPTCIVAGGAEQTLDAMITFRGRLLSGSGQTCVTYLEYADAIHDFLAFEWHGPERSQALKDVGAWLGSISSV
ncbi:hypothetical protein OF83DRAFT_1067674 [Amylostereum chailletii]|nr:hypothetical protein OF83DRAFT_1067674 [Amylostereum chailletii]